MMNIGCIGFGNMAQAIVNGLVYKAGMDPSLIHVCAAHYDTCQKNAQKFGVMAYKTSEEVVQNSDMIILAVKPFQIKEVVEPIRKALRSGIVVSIAAGCFYDFFMKTFQSRKHNTFRQYLIRLLPLEKGILVTEEKHSLHAKALEDFISLFWKNSSYRMGER